MSAVLKDAALVVGGIALIATGVGAGLALAEGISYASAAGFVAGAIGVSASTLAVAAAGLSVAAGLTAPKPKSAVSPMQWSADPQRGVPYAMGRCYVAGDIVYRKAWGGSNKYQTVVTIYTGAGPVQSVDTLYVDGVARSVAGDSTVDLGGNTGNMNAGWQVGLTPTGAPLGLGPPDWTDASRLSGYAASTITFRYDTQGHHTMTSTPSCGFVGHWVKAYDPRKDSTYPGGSGSHRVGDESTWEWSENPYLHGLTWILGRKQNGKRVLGAGAPTNAIIMSQFVEGANICDANGWTMGGKVYSTDDKWDSLKRILQAGSGEPVRLGAQIGCIINTPRVSLATITEADIWGDASVQTTQARRDRLNAIVPRYMAEQDVTTQDEDGNLVTAVTWGIVAGSPVVVQDYVNFDGEQRQKEVEYTFVQNLTQAQQLARYDIENAREFGPITLPLRLRWMGYKPGDVVTANLPELNLNGQDILLLQRELSPQDGTVTMTARSETYAKHAYALGQTGTAPATPSVTGPPLVPVPGETAWALTGGTITSAMGTTIPVLQIVGATDSPVVDAIIFEYRTSQVGGDAPAASGPWITVSTQPPSIELLNITGVQDQAAYDVAVSYRMGVQISTRLILGPATAGMTSVPYQTGVTGPKPPVDADNTATVFAAAGLSPAQVISSLTINASAIIAQGLRQDDAQTVLDARTLIAGQAVNAYVQNFVNTQTTTNSAIATSLALIGAKTADGTGWIINQDTVVINADGTTLAEKFTEIGTVTASITATVQTLQDIVIGPSGSATARAILALDVNGNASGFTATNDGTTSAFNIVASQFSIVDPTGVARTVFSIVDGKTRMLDVEVDTLKVNTAVVPVRSADTTNTVGTFTGPQTTIYTSLPDPVEVRSLTKTITMPVRGYIDFQAWGKLDLPSGSAPWRLALAINGAILPESRRGGDAANDAFSLAGSLLVDPGTYTLTYLFIGHTTVTLMNKFFLANGLPATEAAS